MPFGGLSMFGSGLQLQPVTPGVQNVGNANVSGTMYASRFRVHLASPSDPNNVMIGSFTMGGRTPADWGSPNLMIGEGVTMGSLAGNLVIGTTASAGNGAVSSAQNCILIGNAVVWSGGYGTGQQSVCIGHAAQITNGNQVVIGCNASVAANAAGATVIGASATSTNNAGTAYPVVIGYGATDSGQLNAIRIGQGADPSPAANKISIGDLTHTSAQIGPYVLGTLPKRILLQTADATLTNSIAETAILGAGTGSRTIFSATNATVGLTARVHAAGRISTDAVAPTLLIRMKDDNGDILGSSVAVALPAGLTNVIWEFDGHITIRTLGVGGTARAFGLFKYQTNAGVMQTIQLDQAAPVAINTTLFQAINLYATWGTASANNTITTGIGTIEVIQ